MTIGVVSGFAPAQLGQSASAGMTEGTTAFGDSPFGAMLSMLSGPPAGAIEAVVGALGQAAEQTGLLPAATQMLAINPATATADAAEPIADAEPNLSGALGDLIDALAALQEGTGDEVALDPLAEKHIDDQLAALALALGIELPAGPATTSAPATATHDGEPAVAPAQSAPPALAMLAQKLSELADGLAGKAPELAARLEAFATRLGAGDLNADALARLGLDPAADALNPELADALARLLAPRPETRPAASAPFANASLALPALGDAAPGDARQPAASEPAEGRSRPDRSEQAARGEPRAPGRDSFQAAFQASLAEDSASTSATATAAGAAVGAETRAIHAAYRAPVQQINLPQMAVEIVRHIEAGSSRFQIRLDPPELGRIDVKLEVDKSGNVTARMTVERAETLDLMQRDQRALEKALAQAGLDTAKTNLEFSLKQNPFARDGQPQQQGGDGRPGLPRFGAAEPDSSSSIPEVASYRGHVSASGVNLFV